MPRVLVKADPFEKWRGVVLGRMYARNMSLTELSERMNVNSKTMSAYLKDPDRMQVDKLRHLHRVLNVPADEARAALPMW